jgi:hypothetical protein
MSYLNRQPIRHLFMTLRVDAIRQRPPNSLAPLGQCERAARVLSAATGAPALKSMS